MFRKMLTASLLITAMLLSVVALGGTTAEAQSESGRTPPTCSYADVVAFGLECADQEAYSAFSVKPAPAEGAFGWGSLNPQATAGATAATAAATGGTGGGLAVTGSESAVLGYVGAGLVAFGAVALGSRRKFFQGTLED